MNIERIQPMKPAQQETRIALLEQSIGHINETLVRLEKRFDKLDDISLSHFTRLESSIDKLRDKMDSTTKWLVGIGISVLFSAASLGMSVYQNFHH